MARVTPEEVRDLLPATRKEVGFQAFIELATLVADGLPVSLSASRLKEIERNLAAHYYTESVLPQMASASSGGRSMAMHPISEGGGSLERTPFGRAAMTLDTSGKLAQMGETEASFTFLGS